MEVKVQKIDPQRRIEQIRLFRVDDGILVGNLLGESPILIWHKEGSCFVAAGPDFAQRLGDALDCAREASEALDETHCDEEWIADFKEREDALLAKSARRGVPVPYCTVRVHADGSLWGVVEPRVEQFTATAQQVCAWTWTRPRAASRWRARPSASSTAAPATQASPAQKNEVSIPRRAGRVVG